MKNNTISPDLGQHEFHLEPEQLLGVSDNSHMVDRYSNLRELAASNILGRLTAESSEFVRRQGELNWGFVESVAGGLRNAQVDTTMKARSSFNIVNDIYYVGTVENASPEFRVSGSSNELGATESSIVAELAGIRSAVVWLELDTKDSLEITDGGYGKASFGEEKIWTPHVIAGHCSSGDEKTEVLFMPIYGGWSGGSRRLTSAHEKHHVYGKKNDILKGRATITPRNYMLRTVMMTEQYSKMTAVQDALLSDGLSTEELAGSHDQQTGDFIIGEDTLRTVNIKPTKKIILPFARAPGDQHDLDREEFDAHILDRFNGHISPEEFLKYNVADDCHRAAAMLGRVSVFDGAKKQLINKSMQDPELKFLSDNS